MYSVCILTVFVFISVQSWICFCTCVYKCSSIYGGNKSIINV